MSEETSGFDRDESVSGITAAHLRQLVGNPNAYAVQLDDGGWFPVRKVLSAGVLFDHLRGDITVGTYVNKVDKARTLVFDIDEPDQVKAEAIVDILYDLGLPTPPGVELSGNKGYHVWVVLNNFVPASQLRHLGRIVTSLAGVECEVFPKQDNAPDLGNLVKLPGGIHRVTGKRSEYLTPPPKPLPIGTFRRIMASLPPIPEPKNGTGEAPVALHCMAEIQAGLGEGQRNRGMFQFLTQLRRASVDNYILRAAAERLNRKFKPPLEQDELESIIDSSRLSGPICGQLDDSIRCPDCPVLRKRGLHTKAGQLRQGAEGELAVVELGPTRKDGGLELIHPDLENGILRLKG